MIETICIKSFKSLESVEIDLGRINVFIGANGSGKSNLLEAIGVLSAAANGKVDSESLMRRGVRPGTPENYGCAIKKKERKSFDGEIELSAINKDTSYTVSSAYQTTQVKVKFKSDWQYKNESLNHLGNEILMRTDQMNPEVGLAALKLIDKQKDDPIFQFLNTLQNYAIYSPLTPVLRNTIPEQQPRYPIGLSGGGLGNALVILSHFEEYNLAYHDFFDLIDWAETLFLIGEIYKEQAPEVYFVDRFFNEEGDRLTAKDVSEGALYVLFTMILAIHPAAPRFLAIDNADHGLNPRLAKSLFERLCKWVLAEEQNPRQMLITTHNPLVLDGLLLQDDRVRLFAVDRTNRGCTTVKRVVINPEFFKREGSLSRAWVMGHLGGMPNV